MKSSCFLRCFRNKSKPCSSQSRLHPGTGSGFSGSHLQQGNGRGKHLFVTLNGQRHDVLVETLEG